MSTEPQTSEPKPAPAEAVDPNQHVREYLSYYIEFKHAPHYAVLLNGAWGIGKTFLIRKILDEYYAGKEKKYIYLSLYGLSSFEELDRALMSAIYPVLDKRYIKLASKAAKVALSFVKVKNEFDLTDISSKFKDRLYVFDDLERCALSVQQVMGYINEFVEHEGCKVIIIANENSIKEKPEYLDRREKTVGKVLEVQSAVHHALAFFISNVEDADTRTFLQVRTEQIGNLFAQSNSHNLRVLQQTLWDFERLYKVIDPTRKGNDAAMRVLLSLIFSLSFEVKSGRLNQQEVASRFEYQWFSFIKETKKDKPLTRMEESILRYEGVDLTDAILSNEVCIDILFKGLLRPSDIDSCIAASPHFQESTEQLPWRLVWNLMDVPDDVFTKALTKMEQQFVDHEFIIPGETLHVFGLRLWTASEGLLGISRAKAFEQNRAYVDYMFEQGKLDHLEPETWPSSLSGYGGLVMQQEQTDDFKELVNYYDEKRKQARLNQHPVWGEEVLSDMKNNVDIFSKIALQNGVRNPYYQIPVLGTIEPAKFVQTWLSMQPSAQKSLAIALDGRYIHGTLNGALQTELPWLHQVKVEAEKQLVSATSAAQVRFRRLFSWSVDKYLPKPDQDETDEPEVDTPNSSGDDTP
jgi:hypothetical protein